MAALYDGNGDRIFRLDYRKNSDYVSNKAGTAENVYYPTSSVESAYDTDVILNEMLIPNGVTQNTAINYELTGYINDINTEYTQTLMEFGANGSTTNVYEYGDGRNSAAINGTKGYYLYDGRGSVAGLTGNSGGSMITYSYDAYGNTTKSNNTLNNPYQYNAEYTDSSTGLQYLRARYYDSSQGRFTTKDTLLGSIEKPITLNLYTYCGNNPLNITDPSGHGWFKNAWNSVKKTATKAVNAVKNVANKYIVKPIQSFIRDPKGTAERACQNIKTQVRNIRTQATQKWNDFKTKTSDKWNTFKSDVSAKTQKAIDEVKRFVCTTKDRIVKDAKEFVSNVDWDKVAKGVMTAVAATAVVAVGVAAIAATGGAAAPAIAALAAGTATTFDVITIGTLAAGVTATAFGAADAFEAGQDLASGFAGDSDYVSFNPIRDTVFKNEPELYYLTETVVTYGAGAGTQMVNSMKVQDTPSNGQSSNSNTTSGGRLGNEATRKQNSEIAEYLKGEGYEITGGGGLTKEEYLPSLDGGRKGSNYVDITATKNGETIRINTVDTYANGTPTAREQNAAQMINSKTPNDRNIILIPKGDGLGNLPDIIGGK